MASIVMFPLLHRAAPRLARYFFACKSCMKSPAGLQFGSQFRCRSGLSSPYRSKGNTPFLQAFRLQSTTSPVPQKPSPLGALSRTIGQSGGVEPIVTKTKPFFPKKSSKGVAYWLLGSAASVYGIVVFGGLTRLTESGLSITEWRPVTGTLPPADSTAWESEFAKYKQSPEFKILNPRMDLEEFKKIYWMEYIHRVWGRVVGLTFLVPSIYFVARRRVSARVAMNLAGITSLIGLQGFVGWWMVKSGLKDDLLAPGSQPRVSQYRLATHLSLAFAVYISMLWNGISILTAHKLQAQPPAALKSTLQTLTSPALRPLQRSVFLLTTLIALTVFSGALVAGLDAGLIYNEFPKMGLGLAPPYAELFNPRYARRPDHADLVWRNMLENESLVQLDHRILATTTFTAVHALWAYSRFSRVAAPLLTLGVRRAMLAVVGLVWCQVLLGISTLIYMVPLPLASLHQAGSLALLTGAVVLGRRVCVPSGVLRALNKQAKGVGMAGGGKRFGTAARHDVGVN